EYCGHVRRIPLRVTLEQTIRPTTLCLSIDLRARLLELFSLLLQAAFERDHFAQILLCRVLPHLLRDLHRAEVRAAHRAKMRELCPLLRQRLVVILLSKLRIERQIELVLPPEFETCF